MHVGTGTAVYGTLAVVVAAAALLSLPGGTPENAAPRADRGDPGTGVSRDCSETVVYTNRGSSMTPVLEPGENVTVLRGYYRCHNVSVGDIVLYNWTGNPVPVVKFVEAVPSDSLTFDGCRVVRNDELVRNAEGTSYCFDGDRKQMLQLYTGGNISGYLLLGNDPNGSLDSTRFGVVEGGRIVGKISLEGS